MNRRKVLSLSAITVLGFVLLPTAALTQQKTLKEQLVGTWTLVSITTKAPDGSPFWGSNPKGLTIFTDNGHFSSHLMRAERPKFTSNNRAQATPDESKAVALGTISSFGTYTVNEANKTYTLRYEGSSYPNQEGTDSTRPFTITGDELKLTNPAPTIGGPPSQQVFRRVK
jgi:Lipocalin-like domain